MATIAGRHRAAPLHDAGDLFEELKEIGAVGLAVLLLGLMDGMVGMALWQVSPVLATAVTVVLAVGVVMLVHRMRRPTDG